MTSTWRISVSVPITSVAAPSLNWTSLIAACYRHRGAHALIIARHHNVADESQTSSNSVGSTQPTLGIKEHTEISGPNPGESLITFLHFFQAGRMPLRFA